MSMSLPGVKCGWLTASFSNSCLFPPSHAECWHLCRGRIMWPRRQRCLLTVDERGQGGLGEARGKPFHGAGPPVLPLAQATKLTVSSRGKHEGACAEAICFRTKAGKRKEERKKRKGAECSLWREATSRYWLESYLSVSCHCWSQIGKMTLFWPKVPDIIWAQHLLNLILIHMPLPEADLFPRSISVIGERKDSLKAETPDSSLASADGGSKKKFKWNIKVGRILSFDITFCTDTMPIWHSFFQMPSLDSLPPFYVWHMTVSNL